VHAANGYLYGPIPQVVVADSLVSGNKFGLYASSFGGPVTIVAVRNVITRNSFFGIGISGGPATIAMIDNAVTENFTGVQI
jgi:hypothetical protein